MAVCVLLPEAEAWLAQQEDIELPQPPPRPVRKKAPTTLHPILLKERMFCEARMARDRHRADPANHRDYCGWCRNQK